MPPRIVDLIARKRAGGELSADELAALVDGYLRGDVPDYQVAAWLMAVCWRGMTRRETTDFTLLLARSGEMLDLGALGARAVDKHSTGGVGDKTTLAVAPLVAACGVPVAKLSGRGLGFTGGTLDKLESIPGLRVSLSTDELIRQVERIGIAVASQSADLAPADGKLYALRDVTATVESIPLIASSVMSKKLAAGAGSIVLDVKAGRGAFMKRVEDATTLAETMVEIGRGAGRRVSAVISSMEQPLGNAVGNALEVREAVQTLRGEGPADFTALVRTLAERCLLTSRAAARQEEAAEMLDRAWRSGAGLAKLAEMVEAQGGDRGYVESPDLLPRAPIVEVVRAPRVGYVRSIDAEEVGLTAGALGAGRARKGDPVDPAVGIVFGRKVGDRVEAGAALAEVHARRREDVEPAARRLLAAIEIGEGAVAPQPLILAIRDSA